MANALDAFRAQREAVAELHARVIDVAALIAQVRSEVDLIARHETLRGVLQDEQRWLEQTRQAVREVRAWREQEARRYWPGVALRWIVAGIFALLSAATAGTVYARVTRPYEAEIRYLRQRQDFAEAVERRMLTMTPAERRQFDALMKLTTQER
jgi:hypothetical protein